MRIARLLILTLVLAVPAPALPAPQPLRAIPVPVGFLAAEGADFGTLRAAGAAAVKLVANWSEIEPQQGRLDWSLLDGAVATARSVGLRVVLVLAYTPRWASVAAGPDLNEPAIYTRLPARRVEDWYAFVAAAAARYKGSARDWQVWTARSLPVFRGTSTEYARLLEAAAVAVKAEDPAARIVLSTPFGMDLIDIRAMLGNAGDHFDVISLAPRQTAPDALLRPLNVLRERVLAGAAKAVWIEWDPYSFGQRATWPGQMVKLQAIARASGAEMVFWAGDSTAVTQEVLQTLGAHLGRKAYAGHVVRAPLLMLVFGDADATAVAWSTAGDVPLTLDAAEVRVLTPLGAAAPVAQEAGRATVSVGPEPVLITGIGAATLAGAGLGQGLPPPPTTVDYSQAAEVTAQLGRVNVERGLYNAPYRILRFGALDAVDVDGSEAVRTVGAKEIVDVYFDVDDSFLYYVDGRAVVEIEVEVKGASAPQLVGFSIFYDSTSGYRFSPRQWVDASSGWVTYTVRLADASFTNTWGWDFAIHAPGNQREELTVRKVTVRKVTR